MTPSLLLVAAVWCLSAQGRYPLTSAFQPISPFSTSTSSRTRPAVPRATSSTKLGLLPEINDSLHQLSTSVPPSATTSIIVASDDGAGTWRQYVSLAVVVGVLIDIVLGSPIANLALGPMRRASEKGAGGDSDDDSEGGGGGSLFSAFNTDGGDGSGGIGSGRGRERVDSAAIARAALDKAEGTLELKRFLEENKTDEQRYEDMRKNLDRQMDELDD